MSELYVEYKAAGRRGALTDDGFAIVMSEAQGRQHDRETRVRLMKLGKIVPEAEQTLQQLLTPRPCGLRKDGSIR